LNKLFSSGHKLVQQVLAMQLQEGKALQQDILQRGDILARELQAIEQRALWY